MTFLKKIDTRLAVDASLQSEHIGTRERYKSIIRQLPARTYIDKLVPIYFREFNWQYYGLDEDVFMRQLDEWNNLPLSVFNTQGPQALSPDLRAFPALLFQVIATALLLLPPGGSETTFEALKYAGGMTFEDLAMDYSESGMSVLSLLGKRQMSITTVLTGFLRASFLKYVAMVTEAVSIFFSPAEPLGGANPFLLLLRSGADRGPPVGNLLRSGMPSVAPSETPRRSGCTGTTWIPSRRATRPKPSSRTSGRSSAAAGCG